MNKLNVLIEGYAKETENGWLASSTTALIQTDKHNIIVDPGINKDLLLKKLEEESLTPKDIDYVFMTHYHPDHMFLSAVFENAVCFDGDTMYKGDQEIGFEGTLPDTNIKVVFTPGHAHEHACLVVETENLGVVVIAADVFWWTDEEKQDINEKVLLDRKDPFTRDRQALVESRKKILEMADWIIPGHGKMFRNPTRNTVKSTH